MGAYVSPRQMSTSVDSERSNKYCELFKFSDGAFWGLKVEGKNNLVLVVDYLYG